MKSLSPSRFVGAIVVTVAVLGAALVAGHELTQRRAQQDTDFQAFAPPPAGSAGAAVAAPVRCDSAALNAGTERFSDPTWSPDSTILAATHLGADLPASRISLLYGSAERQPRDDVERLRVAGRHAAVLARTRASRVARRQRRSAFRDRIGIRAVARLRAVVQWRRISLRARSARQRTDRAIPHRRDGGWSGVAAGRARVVFVGADRPQAARAVPRSGIAVQRGQAVGDDGKFRSWRNVRRVVVGRASSAVRLTVIDHAPGLGRQAARSGGEC